MKGMEDQLEEEFARRRVAKGGGDGVRDDGPKKESFPPPTSPTSPFPASVERDEDLGRTEPFRRKERTHRLRAVQPWIPKTEEDVRQIRSGVVSHLSYPSVER